MQRVHCDSMTGRRRPAGSDPRGPWPRRDGRAALNRLGHERRAATRRLRASEAGRLWSRLNAVDFFGNSFQLAALAILCFFPFLIVVTAATDRDAAAVVAGWLGLDQQASRAVADLITSAPGWGTLTTVSILLLILGAVAIAGTLQGWYRRVFDTSSRGWRRDWAAQLLWLGSLFCYGTAQSATGRVLGLSGGPVAQGLAGLVLAVLFWWWSMAMLLAGTVRWRPLLPAALATAVCWTGLGVFSARYFSETIVANEHSYGPIGTVMTILSWLVAVGVVVHLGAAVGRLYLDHRARSVPAGGG